MKRGAFVVLEGLDGAGTTTQLERLAGVFRARGRRVVTTCEPSQGPVGALIRQALAGRLGIAGGGALSHETLALLFAADRADHLQSEVLPALKRGALVLSDRYLLSSLAYQGSQLPMDWVAELNGFAVAPDLTLFLAVDVRTAAKRRAKRGSAEELYEAMDHQRRIARKYEEAIALRAKMEPIERIDASRSVEQVTRAATAAIERLLR